MKNLHVQKAVGNNHATSIASLYGRGVGGLGGMYPSRRARRFSLSCSVLFEHHLDKRQ